MWMTLIATVGGGLVTLAGVSVGFLFARRSDKQKRWQEDVTFWINALSAIDLEILKANPTTQDEARELQSKVMWDLLCLLKSRPSPRNTIGDVVNMSVSGGILVGATPPGMKVTPDMDWKAFQHLFAEAEIDYKSGVGLIRRVLIDTVELLQHWRTNGVSQSAIKRALITRMNQLGLGRVPDDRKTGPSSYHGGWI